MPPVEEGPQADARAVATQGCVSSLAPVGLLRSQGKQAASAVQRKRRGTVGPQHEQGDSSRSLLQLDLTCSVPSAAGAPDLRCPRSGHCRSLFRAPVRLPSQLQLCLESERPPGIREAPWGELGGSESESLAGPASNPPVRPQTVDDLHRQCPSRACSAPLCAPRNCLFVPP